ncbi:MAG: DUF488 family protein [Ktedonobacteraceae bacterium]|nr:DUF488 family protein [Ktedonobacteraceae bacterium]
MIRTASVYHLKRLPDVEQAAYGLRVLVMRRWPRGIARSLIDRWMPDAAPSSELLDAYRAGCLPWQDFATAYRAGLSISLLEQLCQMEQDHGTLTVLCWEPDGQPCHRYLLQQALEEHA